MKKFLSLILALTFVVSLCVFPSSAIYDEESTFNASSEADPQTSLGELGISPQDQTYRVTRYANVHDGDIIIGLKIQVEVLEDPTYASGYRIVGIPSAVKVVSYPQNLVEHIFDDATLSSIKIFPDKQSASFTATVKIQYLHSTKYTSVPLLGTVDL